MKVKKKKMMFMIAKAQEAVSIEQFLLRWRAHDEPLLRP